MGIGIVGFFIYSVATLNSAASLLCFSMGFLHYMLYYRHTRKFRVVYFDEKYIYYDAHVLPLEQVMEVGEKEIVVDNGGGIHEILYFNYFFSNIKLLQEHIDSATRSR